MAGVLFQARTKDFSLLHGFQTGTESHSFSYTTGTGSSFSGSKVVEV
jgi:hypothetical protein